MQQENQTHLFNEITFDQTAKQHLRSITSWSMVIVTVSVIGYIVSIIQVFFTSKPALPKDEGFGDYVSLSSSDTASAIISIALGLTINFFLFRFATQAKAGMDGLDQNRLSKSFGSLKSYFIIMAVLFIIIFVAVIFTAGIFAVGGFK